MAILILKYYRIVTIGASTRKALEYSGNEMHRIIRHTGLETVLFLYDGRIIKLKGPA